MFNIVINYIFINSEQYFEFKPLRYWEFSITLIFSRQILATLHVRHVKPSPTIQLAHAKALKKVNAQYDMTRVALKTFTFGKARNPCP